MMSDAPGVEVWLADVSAYVDRLESSTAEINASLDDLRLSTIEAGPSKIEPSLVELATRLARLEKLVLDRDELVRRDDSPGCLTLFDGLLSLRTVEAAALAKRCRRAADGVADTHGRATSLFVCHYHLQDLTAGLLRVVTGDTRGETYGRPGTQPSGGETHTRPDGGIFDEAA